jgi:phosphoribosyl 1,2-cyclic phosphate phosphodiesterase
LRITPVPLIHSKPCLGYVFETGRARLAYLSDTVGLPQPARDHLAGQPPDLAIIDGTHPPTQHHPRNHNNLDHVRELHGAIASRRTVVTHVGHDMAEWLLDHESSLPADITVGRDGDRHDLGAGA